MKAHVLSVGQCTADDYRLGNVLNVEADAHLDRAGTVAEALSKMAARSYDLVLVNRILDGDGASGVEFIGEVKRAADSPCLMLVSDYPEAQSEAVAKGAKPGFGKSALGTPEIGQRLRETLHSCTRAGNEKVAPPKPVKT